MGPEVSGIFGSEPLAIGEWLAGIAAGDDLGEIPSRSKRSAVRVVMSS